MIKENAGLEFRLKKLDETRIYLLDEIKHNDLIIKKYKKMQRNLIYLEHFCLFISGISGCVLISAFAPLVGSCRYYQFYSMNKDIYNQCKN